MPTGTISFDEAVTILAPSIGVHQVETEQLVVAAIHTGGVQVQDESGAKFDFHSAPKSKGFGQAGNVIVNSEFNVFDVGNGWADFERNHDHVAKAWHTNPVQKSNAKSYGLEETWQYDRLQLIEALWRVGQPYNVRYEALQVLKASNASTAKGEKPKVGKKPNPFRDECITYLTGYYRGVSIPKRIEDMHEEIIDFMRKKGVTDDDDDFPEDSTRKDWIAKIKERLVTKQ